MWTSIKNLFEQKTFVVALLSVIALAAAQFGFNINVASAVVTITPVMIFLGFHGWQEALVAKAKVEQETTIKLHAFLHDQRQPSNLSSPPMAPDLMKAERNAQSGFASLRVMLALAATSGALALALATSTTQTGCATVQPVVTDVIDCVKAEAAVVSQGFSVMQIFNEVIAAYQIIATEGLAGVYTIVEGLITKYGGDIVACAIDDYQPPGAGSGSSVGSGSNVALVEGPLALKASLLAKYFPGKHIKHASK